MKLSHPRIAIALMAACMQMPALAAENSRGTWRCGNTYTDQPCKGGKALDFEDLRSATQKREADSTTREARAAADRLERDRVRLEETDGRRRAILIDNSPRTPKANVTAQATGAVARKKKGQNDAAHFSAHDPAGNQKQKVAKADRKRRAKG